MRTHARTGWSGDIFSGNATLIIGIGTAVVLAAVTSAEMAGSNWHLLLYALVSLFFPLMVALFRIKQFGVSDPGAVFLTFFAGYNGFLLCRIAVGDMTGDLKMPYPVTYSSEIYTQAAFFSFVFSVMLGGTLLFLAVRPPRRTMFQDDVNPIAASGYPVGIAFFLIGLIFFFMNAAKIGGFRVVLGMSKMERFELTRDAGLFLPYMPFTTVGLMLLALAFWKTRSMLTFTTLSTALVFWGVLGLLIGDRTAVAYSLLSVVGLFAFLRSWKLSTKLVVSALLLYVSFTVYAQTRWIIPRIIEGHMTSEDAREWVQENSAADWIVPERSEFAGPYYSLVYAIDTPSRLRWGKSYMDGLIWFLPQKLYPGKKPLPIGNEFAIEIHSRFASAYFPVSGWGYSPVAEAYVNFSWPGVVIVPIFIGIFVDLLERLRWRGALGLLCVMAVLPQMQNANRINFSWAWTESLFSVVVCALALAVARFVANSMAFNRPAERLSARTSRA